MKKLFCFLLCLTLIFSSFSLCFAAVSDSQAASIVSDLSTVKTTLNNIYTRLGTIMNYLYDDGHSVGYWASAIASWMQPIYQALTNNLVSALDIEPIIAGLNEVVSSGGNTSYTPYLKYGGKSNANWLSDIYSFFNMNGFSGSNIAYDTLGSSGNVVNVSRAIPYNNWIKNLLYLDQVYNNAHIAGFSYMTNGFNANQNVVNWGNLSTSTFRPYSVGDGIYKYLNAIQAPVARLSYVLASDERIEAQEAASANEQAVVDNFIDSNGSGAASTSDFDSIADFSSGYKSTFASDASPTGIFDIFNSNNMGWFSQETVDQLDTTSNNRAKSDNTFNTPLLDEQIQSIYEQLGVKQP